MLVRNPGEKSHITSEPSQQTPARSWGCWQVEKAFILGFTWATH